VSDREARQPGTSGDFGSLLPNRWQQLSPLVDAVLDAPPERRSSVLMEVSAGDAQLRTEVERLVDECERGVSMLDRPVAEGFSWLLVEEEDGGVPEVLGGRYRIEREVGRGGMARVYLARDLKHSRAVAVKVIRRDLAASLGRDRFLREIEIAAGLRHPNIVPVYDSGDADGVLYFVMPYEEGPSLRERLRAGPQLPPAECLHVLRDVARALAYAHGHGIVHRDVKPDNVMLSGGAAVVTDFGIAKAIAAASGDDRPERDGTADPFPTITQVGSSIGTPAYMAPEQGVGDPSIDHRADIYSFGCLAYELFAGQPPFHDLATPEIIAAHVGTNPVPLSDVSAAVPESVSRLVARCLEKRPNARPQSAQELLAELERTATGPNEAGRRRRPLPRAALVTSAVVGLALTGYLITRDRPSSVANARARERPTRAVNPEAERLYQVGQRALAQRGQRMKVIIDRFKSAAELDTLYADAFSGLSLALALAPYFEDTSTRQISGPVRSAAERALRLDPTLAPPHVALGLVHQFEYQWDSAAAEFETAVRLRKPDDIEPLVQYGRYMLHQGRAADALKQFLAARHAEPASALVSSWVAFAYFLQGQMDSALVESARAFQNDSTNYTTLQNGAYIRLKLGDLAGARDLVNRLSPYDSRRLYVLAVMGDTATALGRLRELERERPPRWLAPTTRAYTMLAIGDTTEAMAALERATDANEFWPAFGGVLDPMYDPIRSSSRFHALLRRVNLPLSEAIIGPRPVSR
jgi:serine/threonine protein kinase/tetratricopeptide (TPR) repeat protein